MLMLSCKNDDDDDGIDNPTPTQVVNTYSGSGSNGDLLTFEIDQTNQTWETYNESTGQTDTGSYIIMSANMAGIYKVVTGSDTFYSVEMVDEFLVANFPTGNPLNNLSFGVTSEPSHVNTLANIAGDYVFIEVDGDGYFDDSRYKEWGVITVYTNGVFEGMSYATGGTYPAHEIIAPEDWVDGFPLDQDSVKFDGSFTIDGTHNEQLTVTMTQDSTGNYHGYAYATANSGVFIIDKGYGEGFILCVKVDQSSTLSSIAANYKFISVFDGNQSVAGNAQITTSGGTYYQESGNYSESGTLQNIQQCPNIPNMYYATMYSTQPDGELYFVVNEHIFFMIGFDTAGEFIEYGAGARL